MAHLTDKKRVFIPKDHKLQTGYYYLVIKNPTSKEINTTIVAYTHGIPSYNLKNLFIMSLITIQIIFIIIYLHIKVNILK